MPDSLNMAQRTGLEPATPGVTGRYSNRLNYRCASVQALSAYALAYASLSGVVGDDGIEPPTFCL
ncbi:Secreted protein [Pseudomonas sp. IT-P2]